MLKNSLTLRYIDDLNNSTFSKEIAYIYPYGAFIKENNRELYCGIVLRYLYSYDELYIGLLLLFMTKEIVLTFLSWRVIFQRNRHMAYIYHSWLE